MLIHTADPSAFFQPITPENERYEELARRPEWHYPAEHFPARQELLAARERLFARHPGTRFIAAHLGNDAEDLADAARMLDAYPNVWVDIASRISELGRQPYSARDFYCLSESSCLQPGTRQERHTSYWRFWKRRVFSLLEGHSPQGLWRIW